MNEEKVSTWWVSVNDVPSEWKQGQILLGVDDAGCFHPYIFVEDKLHDEITGLCIGQEWVGDQPKYLCLLPNTSRLDILYG